MKFTSVFQHFEKNMSLMPYVFPKSQTAKDLDRPMSKRRYFRTPFDSQHVKGSKRHMKSAYQQFYHIFSSLWRKVSFKMFLLVTSEIFGLFVNTLTADDLYFLCNSENKKRFLNFWLHFSNLHQI